jgi:hypothetical protein
VLRRLNLTKSIVQKAIPRLAARAEIETDSNGRSRLVDPLFAEWVSRGRG